MRFGANDGQAPVRLAENTQIDSLVDISRGGIAVRHHNDLKVGDVVPVQISCGNLDFTADVKVVSATSRRAGAEFINLDQATANKILYLNIMLEEQTAAKRLNNKNLSFVR